MHCVCVQKANTSGGKEGPRCRCRIISSCIYMQIRISAATMELSKSLSHHREMDFIPGHRGCGWRPGWIHMSSSLDASEPNDSSSIMGEGKQPGPFSVCANVREKGQISGISSSRAEGSWNTFSRRNRRACDAGRWLLLHRENNQRRLRLNIQFIKPATQWALHINSEGEW